MATDVEFHPPGPGKWILDRSHYSSGMTAISEELMGDAVRVAYEELFETLGVPLKTVGFTSVNGFPYGRSVPLVAASNESTRTPPAWLVKMLFRLHPALRRRNQAAARFLQQPTFAAVVADWTNNIRPGLLARNAELHAVAVASLDDNELAAHLETVIGHARHTLQEHHRLHGYDLLPIGQLIVAGNEWGFGPTEVLPALAGASPATAEPLEQLTQIRTMLEEAEVTPTTLEEAREASPAVADALDTYLARHGGVLYSSYDVDSPTLGERPDVVLRTILSAKMPADPEAAAHTVAERLRSRLSAPERGRFDALLNEARHAMNMRDDNGPLTVEWPVGILRLVLLEVGRRLAASGRITDPEHVFELGSGQVIPLFISGSGPEAGELATRASQRAASRLLSPPSLLGPDIPDPDVSIFPTATSTMLEAILTVAEHLLTPEAPRFSAADDLTGIGVGVRAYEGVARLASSADEALNALDDGDVLVTNATSPAFNLVLTIAGGLVTAEGGAMAHAAILARELDLPAVIGAAGCLDQIEDGDRIRVDPVNGRVTVLS